MCRKPRALSRGGLACLGDQLQSDACVCIPARMSLNIRVTVRDLLILCRTGGWRSTTLCTPLSI
jgi:hypothetical protein